MSRTRSAACYGWVVVAVAFLALLVNYGVRSTQTVLIMGYSDDLGLGRGAASLPFTVSVLVYALLAPPVGRLVDRYGPRWVMVVGALVSGLGLWMSSKADSLFGLVFFFGIVFGLGASGIGLVPANTSVAACFQKRLGLALGLATMGIGFGTMILPRIAGLVYSHWGWRASFQFLGYIAWALVLPVFFLLRGGGMPERNGEGTPRKGGGSETVARAGLTLREAMRTPSFWLLFAGYVLAVIAIYGVQLHQVPFATDQGIGTEWAQWSVFTFGAASIAGRFFFGRLSDHTREKKQALYPACVFLFAGVSLLFLVSKVWQLMLFSLIFGFGFAAYGPVIPAICAEVFGKGNMGVIFGVVTTGGALGGAAGPLVTGFIYDRTGGYTWAWILTLACVAVSTLLFSRVRGLLPGNGGEPSRLT